ncbi:TIGR00375 family protein [archaeon]|nr:TIGR00375 family protein [archaeon]
MADFLEVNADLHIHGLFSGAVSKNMIPKVLGEQAPLKGLHLLGTADILNSRWLSLIKSQLTMEDEGIFSYSSQKGKTRFVLQTEVEDSNRTHHIILFPSLSKVEEVREKLKSKCKNLDTDGRPKLWLDGEQLAEICKEAECLLGFAHAFTPYFGCLAHFSSYKQCYGKYWSTIRFLELGLSADTDMADRIKELHELAFTSNSDGHSPTPNKLGREFNTFLMKDYSFEELAKAIKLENGRKCILNVKFNPLEGKYHKTRCSGCLLFYEPKEAEKLKWRCPQCHASIKKGVDYRIEELATLPKGMHPEHRPKCIHTIPLNEIIALAYKIQDAWSVKVQGIWKQFVDAFGTEINVLLKAEHNELKKIEPLVASTIMLFRENKISYVPGGAGVYGKLILPGNESNLKDALNQNKPQKTIMEF